MAGYNAPAMRLKKEQPMPGLTRVDPDWRSLEGLQEAEDLDAQMEARAQTVKELREWEREWRSE